METKNLKTIQKAFARLKTNKCVVVDADAIQITNDYVRFGNLEVYVKVNVETDLDLTLSGSMFNKLVKNFESLTQLSPTEVEADKGKIKLPHQEIIPYKSIEKIELSLDATKDDVVQMYDSIDYVGNDQFRVNMQNVAINEEHIVATNAHYLRYKKIKGEYHKDMLVSPIALELIKDLDPKFEQSWSFGYDKDNDWGIAYSDGIKIVFRRCTDNYPNWQAVMPKDYTTTAIVDVKALDKTVSQAILFANESTKHVVFSINGTFNVSAEDLDYKHEFSKDVQGAYKKEGNDLRIGFNGHFINKILADIKEPVCKIELSTPNRGAIFNEEFLLMPVMLY